MNGSPLSTRSPVRPMAWLALASLAVAAGWSAVWYFASRQVDLRLDAWLLNEHRLGRDWTCPKRRITGFPVKIELTCDQPSFVAASSEGGGRGQLKSLRVVARMMQPNRVVARAEAPLELSMQGGAPFATIKWDGFAISVDGLVSGATQTEVNVVRPSASWRNDTQAVETATADSLRVEFQADRERKPADHAQIAHVTLHGLVVPSLDSLVASPAPANFSTSMILTQTDFPDDLTLPQQLERWRKGEGALEMTALRLEKGQFKFEAQGLFKLDDQHRMQGTLDAKAVGIEPVLARLGLPMATVAVSNLLNGLFKRGTSKLPDATQPLAMALPLRFQNGRVHFGALKTPLELRPLY